jgi:heat shock protein HtpX
MFGANGLKTVLLLGGLTGLFMLIGNLLGGTEGMLMAFIFAIVMNFGAYFFSDKMALSMSGAREVSREQAPQLYGMVEELCARANLPMPKVAIIDQMAPNAFATGRDPNHAVIAVTAGLLQILDRREIYGVLAHELGHVKNRDILISSIAATIGGAITMIAQFGMYFGGGRSNEGGGNSGPGLLGGLLLMLLAPLAAVIIQAAISRSREYGADASGADFYSDPEALASALAKLDAYSKQVPMDVNPAVSSLFIVNPLTGFSMQSLFSTHPPIEDRIARLRAMSMRYR